MLSKNPHHHAKVGRSTKEKQRSRRKQGRRKYFQNTNPNIFHNMDRPRVHPVLPLRTSIIPLQKDDTIDSILRNVRRILNIPEGQLYEDKILCVAIMNHKEDIIAWNSSDDKPLHTYFDDGCCPMVAVYWFFSDRAPELVTKTPLVSEPLGG